MPHKIEISDKTYEDLKEFCSLNGLKIGQYADKLIHDGLMIEMYGDVPFTNYMKPAQGQAEAVKTVMAKLKEQESPEAETKTMDSGDIMFGNQDDVAEAIDKHMGEIVGFKWEGAGGPDILLTRKELIEKEIQKETLNKGETIEKEKDKPIDEETKAQMIETMEKVEAEHPQTYITNQDGEKEIQKEMLKQLGTISASDIEDYVSESKKMQEAALEQAGVPTKVINKITKRRLK
jgi:hypothetical protein